jgi:uncharacterized protein YkwD
MVSIPQSLIHKMGERAVRQKPMKIEVRATLLLAISTLLLSCNLPIPSGEPPALPSSFITTDATNTAIASTTTPLSVTIPPPSLAEIEAITPAIVSSTDIKALTDIISYDDLAEMLSLTNKARCEQGLSPLTANLLLSGAATQHNLDMLLNNYFDHNGTDASTVGDRVSMQGYTWLAVGENLAAGSTSAAETFDLWWESPGHKANILNADFREAGLSHLFQAGSQWSHYWTLVFANQGNKPPTCAEIGF